ncbi:hypothetical protein LCGC14_2400530 [marine sediment metagenome]|uniref:Uncharacterized protein n=1 Tax=marine sediment metagenome TaxID=412755 RepID=A0A0F9CHL1_9ZZZZ
MAFTAEDRRKLDALYTSWFGEEGRGGYIDRVDSTTKSHYNLKRTVYVLIALLFGGGGITGVVLKVINGG